MNVVMLFIILYKVNVFLWIARPELVERCIICFHGLFLELPGIPVSKSFLFFLVTLRFLLFSGCLFNFQFIEHHK